MTFLVKFILDGLIFFTIFWQRFIIFLKTLLLLKLMFTSTINQIPRKRVTSLRKPIYITKFELNSFWRIFIYSTAFFNIYHDVNIF